MQTYTVRTKEGTMIARMVGEPAEQLIRESAGFWRVYNGKTERTVCYELTEDMVWGKEWRNGAMQNYFWTGTIIIKDS